MGLDSVDWSFQDTNSTQHSLRSFGEHAARYWSRRASRKSRHRSDSAEAHQGKAAREVDLRIDRSLAIARDEHAARYHDLDAAVARAAFRGRVVGDRPCLTVTVDVDIRGGYTETGQVVAHADGAA